MVHINTDCINIKAAPGACGGSMCICPKCTAEREEKEAPKLVSILELQGVKIVSIRNSYGKISTHIVPKDFDISTIPVSQ